MPEGRSQLPKYPGEVHGRGTGFGAGKGILKAMRLCGSGGKIRSLITGSHAAESLQNQPALHPEAGNSGGTLPEERDRGQPGIDGAGADAKSTRFAIISICDGRDI